MNVESLIFGHFKQLVILLLVLTVILQAYHGMILHWQKQTQGSGAEDHLANLRSIQRTSNTEKLLMMKMMEQVKDAHVMDSSGSYMIAPNIVTPDTSDLNETLTVCTQSTSNHLHYLVHMTQLWQGPVSIAVFTHGLDVSLALYAIACLHKCYEQVRKQVSFHLMYPLTHPPNISKFVPMEINCHSMNSLISKHNRTNYESNIPYPHNVLRNTAVSYSATPYVLVLDVDMLPSSDLRKQFSQFIHRRGQHANREEQKIVYVLPAFESQNDLKELTKESLLKQWEMSKVQTFYVNVCKKCQRTTDYERWMELPRLPFLDVGYVIEWEDPWEPFYIADRLKLPLYDGRFKQYGFNRISQVCELHIAGFQFAVLNNAFVVHRGFKNAEQFHAQKDAENSENRELFRSYKEELKERYPESKRMC